MPARRRLAMLLAAGGATADALVLLEPLAASDDVEDSATLTLLRGRILEAQGEMDAALKLYDGLLAGPLPSYLTARAKLARGRVLLAQGDPDARLAHGWRQAMVGDDIRHLVAGQAALAFDGHGGLKLLTLG